jgi:hypothetical protein
MLLRNVDSYLPDTWSHNPGHKRYVQFATAGSLLNPKTLSSGNYASVQRRKDETRKGNGHEVACSMMLNQRILPDGSGQLISSSEKHGHAIPKPFA